MSGEIKGPFTIRCDDTELAGLAFFMGLNGIKTASKAFNKAISLATETCVFDAEASADCKEVGNYSVVLSSGAKVDISADRHIRRYGKLVFFIKEEVVAEISEDFLYLKKNKVKP